MLRKLPLLVGLWMCLLLVCSCGAPDEVAISPPEALNGFSSYPAQNEPWLCSGPVGGFPAWAPNFHPWPMNTTNSWCQWQPSPSAGIFPYQVWSCDLVNQPDPIWNGSAYIFSEANFGGSCALVWGGSTAHPLDEFFYDADLVEANGWHSLWTPPGGTQQFTGIKSFKLGPNTAAYFCEGPFTGPAGAPCNAYRSLGFGGTGPHAIGYPNMFWSDGLFFETAAFSLQAVQ